MKSPSTTMPPRPAVQTTLDAVFGVKSKRVDAEVAAASGSTPAKKRRKVSERYFPPRRSFVNGYSSMRCSDSEEVTTVVETVAEEPIPPTGDEVVDGINNLEKDTMHESWYNALQGEFRKPYFKNVCASATPFSLFLT